MEKYENALPPEVNSEHNENTEMPERNSEEDDASKLRGYKIVCAKLGLSMCVYFIFRLPGGLIVLQLSKVSEQLGDSLYNLISTAIIIVMVYVIPLLFTALIFSSFSNYKGKYREMYKKPKRLARALGTFPAMYGLGYGIALLTTIVMYIISVNVSGHSYLDELLRPTTMESTSSVAGILTLVFLLVVIAPVFEEIWVRGIMYDALKPYGTGMAIIISSIIFGFMHGSLYMFFYTTALGFALGYVRYATDSLFTVTILHAMVNSVAAGILVFISLEQMTNGENRVVNTFYWVYIIAVLALIIIGVVVFLSKIRKIRKYKFENPWMAIGPWKKTALFFVSVPVILMLVFVFNELSQGLLVGLFLR